MIVCHCNCIDAEAIERRANALADADPWCVLTPVQIYRSLGKQPSCGGCLPLAANIIVDCLARVRDGDERDARRKDA